MEWELTREDYEKHQIAREGNDGGWGNFNGYVAVVKGNKAAIVNVGHCSCYGTWDSDSCNLSGGSICWIGSLNGLLNIAKRRLDPQMPSRKISVEDYDYNHISALYESILKWNQEQKGTS